MDAYIHMCLVNLQVPEMKYNRIQLVCVAWHKCCYVSVCLCSTCFVVLLWGRKKCGQYTWEFLIFQVLTLLTLYVITFLYDVT